MAQYPTTAATDANLSIAVNSLSTALTGAINNSVTTITVVSTGGFPTAGFITIDTEVISYTGLSGGTQFTGCIRGADGTTAASHLANTTVFHNVVAAHHNSLKDEVKAVETDLINAQQGNGTVAANIALKATDASVVHLAGTETVTGSKTLSAAVGNPIHGTNTNDNAAAGYVGEFISSAQTTYTNFPATGMFGFLTSISLTAGDWDVSCIFNATAAGATVTQTLVGITNSSTGVGFNTGDNGLIITVPTASSDTSGTIVSVRVSIASPTTYYLNYRASYSVSTPMAVGRISARRVR